MASQVEHIKWIVGTQFMVDGFRFQNPRCKHYFLTHQHSDHTTGLRSDFTAGMIYCSPITKRLIVNKNRIPTERVQPLEMDQRHVIDGVGVTLIDANHCPGAAMMLFEVPAAAGACSKAVTRILHCGDMRWQPAMAQHPALAGQPLDVLYLDTTYAAPRHLHPPQDECIARMVEIVREEHAREPRTLFVIGAYSIGKERAFLGTARALGWKLWCEADKVKTMRMLQLPEEDMALLTGERAGARLQVTFMGAALQPEKLLERMRKANFLKVVGFRPTGWTYKRNGKLEVRREGPVTVYGVPYSEHSAFNELQDCVRRLRPRRIIPTVNVTEDPATSRAIVDRFADLMDLRGDKSRLDAYFGGRRCAKQQQQQVASNADAGEAACMRGMQAVEAQRASAEAAASCAASQRSQPEGWPGQCSPAHPIAYCAASEPATPLVRADSCGNASGFDSNTSEWDAMSEGSPPPEEAAEEAADEAKPHRIAFAKGKGAWLMDAALTEDAAQPATHGLAAAAAAAAASAAPAHATSSSPAAYITEHPNAKPGVAYGDDLARLQIPPADTALRDSSGPLDADSTVVPATVPEASAAGGDTLLDSVSVREQEIIMAMIAARNARRSGSCAGSPRAGSGTASAHGSRGSCGSIGASLAMTQSAPLPSAAQPSCSRAAAEDGISPSGRQKRQRTLAGFLVPPAQSCRF